MTDLMGIFSKDSTTFIEVTLCRTPESKKYRAATKFTFCTPLTLNCNVHCPNDKNEIAARDSID